MNEFLKDYLALTEYVSELAHAINEITRVLNNNGLLTQENIDNINKAAIATIEIDKR